MEHANKNLLLMVALFGWATNSPVIPDAAAHDLNGHPSATRLIHLKQGKLSEQEAAEVHQHFSKCGECAEFFAGYGETRATECPKGCKKCTKKSAESAQIQAVAAATPAHPSDAQLALLKTGVLSEADAAAIHEHFAHCPDCATAFAGLDSAPAENAAPQAEVAAVATPAHPSDAQLALLKTGVLSEADAAAIHEHFAHCPDCATAFVGLDSAQPTAPDAPPVSSPSSQPVARVAAQKSNLACAEISNRIDQLQERVTRLIAIARKSQNAPPQSGEDCCSKHRKQLEKLEATIGKLEAALR